MLTREQVREVDRLAIEELGIPGVVLMENAGRGVADVVCGVLGERGVALGSAKVVIVCGGGNNGGDGYVIARHLHNRGVGVTVLAGKGVKGLAGDAGVNAQVCLAMGLSVVDVSDGNLEGVKDIELVDVVVDALLGTGFSGQVRGVVGDLIVWCNRLREAGAAVVAVDVPSGLDCNSGRTGELTVRAEVTVTFVAYKAGFKAESAVGYVGRVVVADIGAPPGLIDRVLGV